MWLPKPLFKLGLLYVLPIVYKSAFRKRSNAHRSILDNNGVPRLVRRVSADTIQPLSGIFIFFGQFWDQLATLCPTETVRFYPISFPSKVVGIGSDYTKHIEEMGRQKPKRPKVFLKRV